jgi:hypothetical protein
MSFLATFPSSHAALAAERRLLDQGLAVELVPVPRQISSDCGFCLLLESAAPVPPAELAACAAQSLWRVTETSVSTSSRKVKSYERYP